MHFLHFIPKNDTGVHSLKYQKQLRPMSVFEPHGRPQL